MSDRCLLHDYEWRHGRNMANAPIGRYCPWDGSMHPDEFMAYLGKPGTRLTPTDKNYKVYIDVTAEACGEDPAEIRVVSARNHGGPAEGWEKVGRKERKAMEKDGWQGDYTYIQFAPRGEQRESKFYFEHLSDEQRRLFIEMLNDGKLNLREPGFFYVRPFFTKVLLDG